MWGNSKVSRSVAWPRRLSRTFWKKIKCYSLNIWVIADLHFLGFPAFSPFSLTHTRAHTSATKCKLMEGRKKEKIRGSEREKRRERLSGLSEPAGNGCGSMNQWMKRIVDDILVPNWIKLRNTEACDKNLRAHLLTLWISISLAFFDCWPSAISHVDWNSQFQLDENGMEFYSRWSNIPASPMSSRRCENPRMSLRMIVDYSKTGCL